VARIVIDEAHKIVTDLAYRDTFSQAHKLAGFVTQKIYLSATLPPELQERFLELTGLPSSTLFIRACTTRPNLRYHVLKVENRVKHIKDVTVDLADFLQNTTFSSTSRGIIFCTDLLTTEELAKRMDAAMSHAKMNEYQRAKNQDKWYTGSYKWMVATTGFIHGVDHPDVKAVIFVTIPFGAINIEQGAGRAGRNGEEANVFLLDCTNVVRAAPHSSQKDDGCLQGAIRWTSTRACRRGVMTNLMDGEDTECSKIPAGLKCDNCDPTTELLQHAKRLAGIAALQPSGARGDEYGDGGLPDELLADLDLSIFDTHQGSTPTYAHPLPVLQALPKDRVEHTLPPTPSSRSSAFSVPMQLTDTSHQKRHQHTSQPSSVAPTSRPSTAVKVDAALYQQQVRSKAEKAKEISRMANCLRGSCQVCWSRTGESIEKGENHIPFLHCRQQQLSSFVEDANGWWDIRKIINLPRYQYCFFCGLPQGQFKPDGHPNPNRDNPGPCHMADFVPIMSWVVFTDPEVYQEAKKAFPGLIDRMSMAQFCQWYDKGDNSAHFYNGLELGLWLWRRCQVQYNRR
jgi:hypothetical protein